MSAHPAQGTSARPALGTSARPADVTITDEAALREATAAPPTSPERRADQTRTEAGVVTRWRVSVRRLALWRRAGDLHVQLDARASAREGITMPQRRPLPDGARREVVARGLYVDANGTLEVVGRADVIVGDAGCPLVEEVKTTRSDAARLHAQTASVNWAQVRLYGHLLAAVEGWAQWRLRLCYVHADTGAETHFERDDTADEARRYFEETCALRVAWQAALIVWRHDRDARLRGLRFPFSTFRGGQKQVAALSYRALRDGTPTVLEAATGLGKTVATLFGALHAMAAGQVRQLVFLSARTTGRQAALRAAGGLGTPLRVVEIAARESVCLSPGSACAGSDCSYAAGHHDRVAPALEALRHVQLASTAVLENVALVHHVCPFALAMAAAHDADLVICDYNHVLDERFPLGLALAATGAEVGVLLDEAHQLPERGSAIHSARLTSSRLLATARIGDAAVARATQQLLAALHASAEFGAVGSGEPALTVLPAIGVVEPAAVSAAVDALHAACERRLASITGSHDTTAMLQAMAFDLAHWQRTRIWSQLAAFVQIAHVVQGDVTFERFCVDATPLLEQRLRAYRGVVAFSATLPGTQPLGVPATPPVARLPSPFPPDRLGVFIVSDVDVRLRARQNSLQRVVAATLAVMAARAGNYLLFAPSFDYLAALGDELARQAPALDIIRQQAAMDAAARSEFVARFRADERTRLGLAITGGLFAESVDFAGNSLIGIVIVGVALPPRSWQRDAVRYHRGTDGEAIAYGLPALIRVLQTAGRLIRSEQDAGILCLIDKRFLAEQWLRGFPRHWQPRALRSGDLAGAAHDFWKPICPS